MSTPAEAVRVHSHALTVNIHCQYSQAAAAQTSAGRNCRQLFCKRAQLSLPSRRPCWASAFRDRGKTSVGCRMLYLTARPHPTRDGRAGHFITASCVSRGCLGLVSQIIHNFPAREGHVACGMRHVTVLSQDLIAHKGCLVSLSHSLDHTLTRKKEISVKNPENQLEPRPRRVIMT